MKRCIAKEEIGNSYGRLTVIKRANNNKHRQAVWLCRCICGNELLVVGSALRKGHTKSCGCLNDEVRRATCKKRSTTHGMTHTRLYVCWVKMKQRIQNPNDNRFSYYGGRGISLCSEWNKFEAFRDWALANGYNDKLTIDRIDNNGPYSPANCRWVSMDVQANNKRGNVFLEYMGKKQTIAQWARDLKIKVPTLWTRLYRYRWTIEQAFTRPLRSSKKRSLL